MAEELRMRRIVVDRESAAALFGGTGRRAFRRASAWFGVPVAYFTERVYSKSYECFLSSILIVILPARPAN